MARITRAAPHLSAEELKARLKLDPRPLYRQRWLIIHNALVEPRKATEKARAYWHDSSDGAPGDCSLQSAAESPQLRRQEKEVAAGSH